MEINVSNNYKKYVLNIFCEKYNITKEQINDNHYYYFRYICFKNTFFMKYVTIPKIKKKNMNEAVMIEFRKLPHIEFIIRNTIIQLGSDWSHTVICGNDNYDMICDICNEISSEINIIKLDVQNKNQSEYSEMLTTVTFWNFFYGEKILIYQEDSFIFKKNIQDFMHFDFIGAPFPKNVNDTPNLVGNGGLSLRSKSKMLEVIQKISVEKTKFNTSTLEYMKNVKLDFPPEDVYFSKNMQELNIGKVSDWNSAFLFSTESVNNPNSFGGHKFWIADKNWKERFKKLFKLTKYHLRSDIQEYLLFNGLPKTYDKTRTIKNAFDVDFYFFTKVNNFSYSFKNNNEIMKSIKNIGLSGYLYHPKQLLNIFPKIFIYNFLDNIFILYKKNIYSVHNFSRKFLYNMSYDELCGNLIKEKYCAFDTEIDLLLLVFIGNEEKGIELIDKIITYKNIEKFNISFCFNSGKLFFSEKIKNKIKNNFDFYAVYLCNELGTDITSTLLMYNEIVKKYTFNHIIKLHSKRIPKHFDDLTSYLLNKPLSSLLMEKRENCNCIGHPKYYMDLFEDIFNNNLKIKYASEINSKKYFVAGTIFYSHRNIFDRMLNFIKKNNFFSFFLNNLYENNTINKDCSPIHFLERLFGVIKLDNL